MSTTVTLRANASAVIDSTQVNTNITPSATWEAKESQNLLLQFEQPASAYNYKKIEHATFNAYVQKGSETGCGLPFEILESFNASTVTWNTQPASNQGDDFDRSQYLDDLDSNGWNSLVFTWRYFLNLYHAADIIKTGILIDPQYDSNGSLLYTSYASSAYKPYIEVTFSDDDVYIRTSGNYTSGYINPHNDITLKWSNVILEECMMNPTQASAVVTWKENGGAEHTTSLTTGTSITIPADTWSTGTSYLWKVDVTDNLGRTTTSGWYTLSTTAAAATPPTLEYPVTVVIDGTGDVTFRWVNNGGENNTGTDLEFSTDGETWGSPINIAAGPSSYVVSAGTLPSGTNYWRARAYNADSTAGSWTDATIFTVISSPQAPYYEVTNTPRPTISWVSDEQQAFQVQMGDYDSGLIFGRAKSFKCPVYLPNGTANVQVRVMNEYNLWSPWSGTQITIANNPGAAPQLTVDAGAEAQLSWTPGYNTAKIDGTQLTWTMGKSISATGSLSGNTPGFGRSDYIALDGATRVRYTGPATGTSDKPYSPMVAFYNGTTFLAREIFKNFDGDVVPVPSGATQMRVVMGYAAAQDETATQTDVEKFAATLYKSAADHYLVYRDGALIGETDGLSYSDRWGIGDVTYMVRAALTGDDYAVSNTVEVTLAVDQPMIAAMDGPWIMLRYTTEPTPTTVINSEQAVSLLQFSGSEYPVPEIAPHRTRVYQINTAFPRGEGAAFEELLGRECFLKDQYGNAVRGVIAAIQKAQNRFFTVYTAALQQIEGDLT